MAINTTASEAETCRNRSAEEQPAPCWLQPQLLVLPHTVPTATTTYHTPASATAWSTDRHDTSMGLRDWNAMRMKQQSELSQGVYILKHTLMGFLGQSQDDPYLTKPSSSASLGSKMLIQYYQLVHKGGLLLNTQDTDIKMNSTTPVKLYFWSKHVLVWVLLIWMLVHAPLTEGGHQETNAIWYERF